MNTTIGTCSLCGGAVVVPMHYYGEPIPTCERCGATKKKPYGAVIDMEATKLRNQEQLVNDILKIRLPIKGD